MGLVAPRPDVGDIVRYAPTKTKGKFAGERPALPPPRQLSRPRYDSPSRRLPVCITIPIMRASVIPRCGAASIALAIVFTFPAFAQKPRRDEPDLTGIWTVNLEKSKPNKDVSLRPQGVEIYDDGHIMEISELINGQKLTFAYRTDGKAAPVAQVPGGSIIAKGYWKNGSFYTEVFGVETTQSDLNRWAGTMLHQVHKWTLSSGGKVLTREINGGKELYVYDLKERFENGDLEDNADGNDDDSDTAKQPPASLSGNWILRSTSGAKIFPTASAGGMTITCSGFDVEMRPISPESTTIDYIADDQPHETGVWQEENSTFTRSYWNGSALITVVTGGSVSWQTQFRSVERWILSDDGRTLTRKFDARYIHLVEVYERQTAAQ